MTFDLFDHTDTPARQWQEPLAPGAVVLRSFAHAEARALHAAVLTVLAKSPPATMVTPGGHCMSVTTTSCGKLGWVSDDSGYRYAEADPQTGRPWPAMPVRLRALAQRAASEAGFDGFDPDACLINVYAPGARMSLHQDRNERDFTAPIVSVSLGLPAVFQFGGFRRADRAQRVPLGHGDVVVWGGESRMRFHGVLPVKPGRHPLTGEARINLTFRKAG
jgi:alkylated DNA repair protein (DNA oxidative demethylase)